MVAELTLIRTRAEVAVRLYNEVVGRYPDPRLLCFMGSPEELERMFARIGLPRRGRWLYEAVCRILDEYDGRPPCREDELVKLPGVGRYMARVVLATVCGAPRAFADTNVVRVVSRLTCRELDERGAEEWLEANVPPDLLRDVNVALIDLAASVCKPRRPRCSACPLSPWCCSRASAGRT